MYSRDNQQFIVIVFAIVLAGIGTITLLIIPAV
jgi:hypothetical protein